MATLNLDSYIGKDLYSDGDVEQEILETAKSGVRPEELERVSFPVLYHLSRARENILSWYPFRAEASCLEIGSGCGAITGLLCSRMRQVVSVELSKRRAEINYARHERCGNLEIRVGNLNDMQFAEGFDYVVLNGAFEYAMSFTEGDDPYGTFLRRVRAFLKPDGVLLVAIENRLGLKYFAGAPEDHTNGYFDGIRGYGDNRAVRTFSRAEWEALMRRCGLNYYKFYYPYPDYKFPREIFTDESLREQKYGRPAWNFTKYRMALFEESRLAETLSAEGVMAQFANSFLIEMSAVPLEREHSVRYAKLSTDRADAFSVMTILEDRPDGRCVRKRPATAQAGAHIRQMLAQEQEHYGLWRPLAGRPEGDGIVYPFLHQKSLGHQAAEAAQRGDAAALKKLVWKVAELCGCAPEPEQLWHAENAGETGGDEDVHAAGTASMRQVCISSLRQMTKDQRMQFGRVFGDRELKADCTCVAPANIDLILDNIFETGDGFQVIDCEWIFDFPVPVAFLLWRAVNELYSNQLSLEALCPKAEFLREFGIAEQAAEVFWDWDTHFAQQYVGANRLLRFSVPEIGISIEEFRQRRREQEYMVSQLFVDTGSGYSEQEKLVTETELSADGCFSLTFDLRGFDGVRAVRFDPVEGRPCVCSIDEKQSTVRLSAANAAAALPEGDLFLTTDPMYQVRLPKDAQRLVICGRIQMLSVEDALNRANRLLTGGHWKLPFHRRHGAGQDS